jgi:hypothetical protein
MTRAEGIAKLLGEHGQFAYNPKVAAYVCDCGLMFFIPAEDAEGDDSLMWKFAKHQAAVVDAWLAGQGEPPEIRHVTLDNGETVLDEVVARDASVHLEAMADNAWWLGIESGGQLVHVNLTTKRAKIDGTAEVD